MPVRFENTSVTDTTVLITAGAAGIGRTLSERFLSLGCSVHVCDIDPSAIERFLADNPQAGASLADVSDAAQVDAMFKDILERYGRLDVLINNAGIAGPTASFEDVSTEDWDRTIGVNLSGQFYVTRLAVPMMKKARSGVIINISSSAALFGCPLRAPYTASKWALIGVTKTLAMELGPWGIRVNAICPGSVEGERIEGVIRRDAIKRGSSPDEIRDAYHRQTSLRRFVTADEVANMAVFLASDLSSSISGQAMSVDGHTETLSNSMWDL
jgi:NAD(P)-dependent dehydrogenase (short-subunit alcohol dehydrogenase family)